MDIPRVWYVCGLTDYTTQSDLYL